MCAVAPIGTRGRSMIQAPLPLGRCAACTVRGRSNGFPRKTVRTRQIPAKPREHTAGPPEYLVASEPPDFAGSLNRSGSRGFAPRADDRHGFSTIHVRRKKNETL